jgi:hypothetical protein
MRPSGISTMPASTAASVPRPASGRPSMLMLPASGAMRPAMVFISVVLPVPLTPTSATSSPFATDRSTSRRTVRRP